MIFLLTSIFLIIFSSISLIINNLNPIYLFIYIELIIINITLIISIIFKIDNNFFGQLYSLLILTIAAIESSLLISLLLQFFRLNNTIAFNNINLIKIKYKNI